MGFLRGDYLTTFLMKVDQTGKTAQWAIFFSSHPRREWLRLDTIRCPALYLTPKYS